MAAARSALRLTLPSRCLVCAHWPCADALCTRCEQRFAALRRRCARCALALTAEAGALCGACSRHAPPFAAAIAALDYAYPWDRLIPAWKYHGRSGLADCFADRMAQAIGQSPKRRALLVPMPMARQHLQERGLHHSLQLTRALARRLERPWRDALLRTRTTPPLAGMDRAERRRAVSGAFAPDPVHAPALRGAVVALVDDVLTTGASAEAATLSLLAAGAREVEVWVLARSP